MIWGPSPPGFNYNKVIVVVVVVVIALFFHIKYKNIYYIKLISRCAMHYSMQTIATNRNQSQPIATNRNQSQPIATNRNQSQPMHIIVVDTETTGLIPKGIASRDLAKCPHIMQLSYMVLNTVDFKIREDYDAIVRIGDDVEISERSIEIHKITREKSKTRGVPINVALYNLKQAVARYGVGLIVGHNIEFDKQMLDIECRRNGLSGLFSGSGSGSSRNGLLDSVSALSGEIPFYCTMENSKDLCNNRVQSMYGGTYTRFSKLGEVFEKLFADVDSHDDTDTTATATTATATTTEMKTESTHSAFMHNSRVDVVMCLRIFVWIAYSVDIKTEWADVMSSYTDTDLIVLDDAHLMTDEIARVNYNIHGTESACCTC